MSEPILDIIQNKLIPWGDQFGAAQIIVARQQLAEMRPRFGFKYSSRKTLGPRQKVHSYSFGMVTAKWPNDYLIESHIPLLTFVTAGEADLPFLDYWIHAREGQGIFTLADVPRNSGERPYLHPTHQKKGFCSTLNFMERQGRIQIWQNRSEKNIHHASGEYKPIYVLNDRALQLLNQMQHHFVAERSDDDLVCLYLLKAFLRTLEKDILAQDYVQIGSLQRLTSHPFPIDNPIGKAQEYIRTHLKDHLTLQHVARQAYMSRTQFALQFHRETGKTFADFLTDCRMEQAKVLLRETEYTFSFICLNIGYRSLTYFRRLFIKKVGMPPSEYRNSHRLK